MFGFKKKTAHMPVNSFGEPIDKLIDGELPWGWVTHNRNIVEPIQNQNRYFIDNWVNSSKKPPIERYEALKSLVLFLQDTKTLMTSKGECFEKWFSDIIADDDYINKRESELQHLTDNFKDIEKAYKEKQNKLKEGTYQ